MPKCTETIKLGKVGRRVVEAAFDGGDIVSDGGVTLLQRTDARIGLTRMAAAAFGDARRKASVRHDMRSLLAQRIYGLCCGWEDVGARQGSCRLIHAAIGCSFASRCAEATTESRSGLSVTAAMGDQSRVCRDQRAGWRSRAWMYSAWRAARIA